MKIIFSDVCLKYSQPGHPESPSRVEKTYRLLKDESFEFLKPEIATEKDILEVHSRDLLEKVKTGQFFDPDTPNYENIFYYARLSAGGAIRALEACLRYKEHSFSLMRPPGHHTNKDNVGGFCYFNNIAIAVTKALEEIERVKRVAIIDIDVHHGNGTQDIFLHNKRVIYVSLHQFPFYPGTGSSSEDNCLNYPLPSETGEELYMKKLEKALEEVKNFSPDLVAVSAGFDTYKNDHIANLRLEIGTYEKIAKAIKNLGFPTFSVLEGGYSPRLAECIYSYLKGFLDKSED